MDDGNKFRATFLLNIFSIPHIHSSISWRSADCNPFHLMLSPNTFFVSPYFTYNPYYCMCHYFQYSKYRMLWILLFLGKSHNNQYVTISHNSKCCSIWSCHSSLISPTWNYIQIPWSPTQLSRGLRRRIWSPQSGSSGQTALSVLNTLSTSRIDRGEYKNPQVQGVSVYRATL